MATDVSSDVGDWVVAGPNVGHLIEPVKIASLINSDEPMMSVKLSFYPKTNQTAIGFMFSHIIGE